MDGGDKSHIRFEVDGDDLKYADIDEAMACKLLSRINFGLYPEMLAVWPIRRCKNRCPCHKRPRRSNLNSKKCPVCPELSVLSTVLVSKKRRAYFKDVQNPC